MSLIRKSRIVGFTLLTALLVAAPALGIWRLGQVASKVDLSTRPATWVPVLVNSTPTTMPVQLILTRAENPPVVAPGWDGLVQASPVKPGATISNGQVVAEINGISRIAAETSQPFFEELTLGDVGNSVGELNLLLSSLGYSYAESNEFSEQTSQGVRTLSSNLGVEKTSVFNPAWVVWLPPGGRVVLTNDLTVGAPAPAAGETIFTFAPTVTAATLGRADSTSPTASSNGPSSSASGGTSDAPVIEAPPVFEPITAPSGANLMVDGSEYRLNTDRSTVRAEDLPTLANAFAESDQVLDGVLEVPAAPGQFTIPAASIYSAASSSLCVRRQRGPVISTVKVEVIGSQYLSTVVSGDLVTGDSVELTPSSSDRSCK